MHANIQNVRTSVCRYWIRVLQRHCVCAWVRRRLCKCWLAISGSRGWRQSWSVFPLCQSFREQIPTLTRLSSAWRSASSSLPAMGRTSSYNRELRHVNPPQTAPRCCLMPNQNHIWSSRRHLMLLSASKLMGCDMWCLITSRKFVMIHLTKMTFK